MPFVIDASAALSWCFDDEKTPGSEALLASLSQDHAVAPAIWPLEVANALLMAAKRGRVSGQDVDGYLVDLMMLPVRFAAAPDPVIVGIVVPLARAHGLTAYDAAYLELALRTKLPLATIDDDLARAAQAEGVVLAL